MKPNNQHGGIYSLGKRRSRRNLNTKQSHHVTLRSDFAKGVRSLIANKKIVDYVIQKASKRFNVKVYEKAICGNHLHLLIFGKTREDIQNFFRVVAGHIAQQILQQFPITEEERRKATGGAPGVRHKSNTGGAPTARNKVRAKTTIPCKKNQRKFWALLIYSRIITWGREFKTVSVYIIKNTLEALNLIAYTPRRRSLSYAFS